MSGYSNILKPMLNTLIQCEGCNDYFSSHSTRSYTEIGKNGKEDNFCSYQCYFNNIHRECAVCSKEFKMSNENVQVCNIGVDSNNRYLWSCSNDCYRSFLKEPHKFINRNQL